jgi:hypothetical protein
MGPELPSDNRELQCRERKRIIKSFSCDDLATHTPQVLGIVQVLGDIPIRRRKTTSYNVEGKSSDNNNLGARKK